MKHRASLFVIAGEVFTSVCFGAAGLLDDLPDGSEERKLQGLEEQVQNQGAKVKAFKQHNVKVCEIGYRISK